MRQSTKSIFSSKCSLELVMTAKIVLDSVCFFFFFLHFSFFFRKYTYKKWREFQQLFGCIWILDIDSMSIEHKTMNLTQAIIINTKKKSRIQQQQNILTYKKQVTKPNNSFVFIIHWYRSTHHFSRMPNKRESITSFALPMVCAMCVSQEMATVSEIPRPNRLRVKQNKEIRNRIAFTQTHQSIALRVIYWIFSVVDRKPEREGEKRSE